ncbi:MAG: BlaI/MecI/CopY family transcriptional regulator [Bacillota bacterium]
MSVKKTLGEFKPMGKGLGKVLGHLEASVMEIVWQKERASVREVYETLLLQRDIAYTTVMTIMGRLADKKILRKDKQGVAYHYSPAFTREEFTRRFVHEVLDGLLEEYAEVAFAHFVSRLQEEDETKIAKLERMIKERQLKGE